MALVQRLPGQGKESCGFSGKRPVAENTSLR